MLMHIRKWRKWAAQIGQTQHVVNTFLSNEQETRIFNRTFKSKKANWNEFAQDLVVNLNLDLMKNHKLL